MAFNVKAKRRPDGNYDLEYGKGGNKLSALMQVREDKMWQVTDGDGASVASHKLKRDCKDAWGQWAEANYSGTSGGVTAKARQPAAPPPPMKFNVAGAQTGRIPRDPPPFRAQGGPPTFAKNAPGEFGIFCLMHGGDWLTDPPHQDHNICRFPTEADAKKWIKNHIVHKDQYEARPIPAGKVRVTPDVKRDGDNEYLADPFSRDMTDQAGHLTPLGALDEVFSFLLTAEVDWTEAPWSAVARTLNRYLPTAAQYQIDTAAA